MASVVDDGSRCCSRRSSVGARVVFVGAHKQPNYVVESYPKPPVDFPLEEGEILLKMRAATICQEDLQVLADRGPGTGNQPRVLGHEGVGVVVCSRLMPSSPEGDPILPGDRLVFSPWSGSCTHCSDCRLDMVQRCPAAQKYGGQQPPSGNGYPNGSSILAGGTFASHLVLRKGTQVSLLPPEIPDTLAAPLACALAPLVRALGYLSTQQRKGTAVIQGGSFQGAYACALMHEAGFAQVYCHEPDPIALKHIARFNGIPIHEQSSALTRQTVPRPGSEGAEVVLRLSGSCCSQSYALELLRPGGILLLLDSELRNRPLQQSSQTNYPLFRHKEPDSFLWETVAKKGITVKGVSGFSQKELTSSVAFLHKTLSKYPYEVLMGPLHTNLYDFPNAVIFATSYSHCRVPVLTP